MSTLAIQLTASAANADQPTQVASTGTTGVAAAASATEISVDVADPAYDGFQLLLDDEAHAALAKGNYPRAWHFFWRLVQIDPYDTRALRECGRIAHAMGKFPHAVETLGRVDELNGHQADPELHYLRGEALLVLGNKAEAEREFRQAERELGPAPQERRQVIWLARMAALRGNLRRSLALYQPLLDEAADDAAHAEITIQMVEAHILSKGWAEAERLLRDFLAEQPDHARAKEMLAWVLDSRGHLDEALAMRAVFAEEWTDHPRKTVEYAQALERAYDYPQALARYRHARWLGVDEVGDDVARLERRLAPELGGGLSLRDDPSGEVQGWVVGASLPLGGRYRIALTGSQEATSGGVTMNELTSKAASAMVIRQGRRGGVAALGATVHQSDLDTTVGGTGVLNTSAARRLQLQLRGDMNLPWRESSSTIREDGAFDAASAQAYYAPWSRKLLFSVGAQARRLTLDASAMGEGTSAYQVLGIGGADLIIRQDHDRTARGEIFDNEMLLPRTLASSTVLSLRHYEMASQDPFGARLVLVERSTIEEVSAVTRHVLDRKGKLAAELRGGIGYDWIRDVQLWRAGASALLSATASSRLTLDYDVASESRTGLVGRRHIGQMVLHVDL